MTVPASTIKQLALLILIYQDVNFNHDLKADVYRIQINGCTFEADNLTDLIHSTGDLLLP